MKIQRQSKEKATKEYCCTNHGIQKITILLVLPMIISERIVGATSIEEAKTEYDFTILDPSNAYGSPLGGFSRATASRLANMPLRLPDVAQELSEFDPTYMNVRDANGREYACRVYHQDEVERSSLYDSMFDLAKVVSEDQLPDLSTSNEKVEEGSVNLVDANEGEGTSKKESRLSKAEQKLRINKEVTKRLDMLKGVCAIYDDGWWSYRWCNEKEVTQVHIDVPNRLEEDKKSLGTFHGRSVPDLNDKRDNDETKGSIAQVHDVFTNGANCPENQKQRKTEVVLQCCSSSDTSKTNRNRFAAYKLDETGNPEEGDTSSLLSGMTIVEDEVCSYKITICTPLLCVDDDDDETGRQNTKQTLVDTKSGGKREINAKSMTVLGIVHSVFGDNKCIRTETGGWWTYELCPGRIIRQFHEVTMVDSVSGELQIHLGTQYVLGEYDATSSAVTKEDEWKYVVNMTSTTSTKAERPATNAPRPSTIGGNGAYFYQEYINGDICDNEDVTDSAIKAGEFGEGGIQRATTVHYSCGSQFGMSVKEDSTCHYIVDVTIPALCGHPLFKGPLSRRQIVKCLPVS